MKSNRSHSVLSVLMVGLLALFTLFAVGCGASGGYDSGEEDGEEPTTPAKPTYNFTGTVYGGNGYPVSDVLVQVFSQMLTTVTNANGQFSMNVPSELHTILSSKDGFIDGYILADLSPGSALGQSVLLHRANAPVVDVAARLGAEVPSNKIGEDQARLAVFPQSAFSVGDQSGLSSVEMSVELIDVSNPLPVPMPAPSTLSADDVIISGKQAPYALVAIKPALLQLESPATLILPSHPDLVGARVLRYDPYIHMWIDTGVRADDSPGDGVALNITKGGPYGLFYETRRVGTVQGSATPGTLVLIGDKIIEVPGNGTFQINEVPVPPGGVITVMSIDPETGRVVESELSIANGEVVTVDLSMITVGSVIVTPQKPRLVANGSATMNVSAEVLGEDDRPVPDGSQVEFTTTMGSLSPSVAKTTNGIATVTLTSSQTVGTATITAVSAGVSGSTTVEFIQAPKTMSLSTDMPAVKSDNSDKAVITATVLNNNNAPYVGATVTFSAGGGQLATYVPPDGSPPEDPDNNPATVVTDFNGQAKIFFSAGAIEKRNQVVTIMADVEGIIEKSIPIQVTGTTVILETETPILEIGGDNESLVTITVLDAGDNPIYDARVTLSDEPAGSLDWVLTEKYADNEVTENGDTYFTTDVDGKLQVAVSGTSPAEKAVLKAESLGATGTLDFKVDDLGKTFAIVEPPDDPWAISIGEELAVVVRAPDQAAVKFSTTFGSWNDTEDQVVDVPTEVVTVNGEPQRRATAYLKATHAGVSTIQVFDVGDTDITDSTKVAVSAPYTDAYKISVQAGRTVVAPSTTDTTNTVTIIASVKTIDDQVVGGAPVLFTLEDTTGGGESLSPVLVFTDSSGVATTTFSSGSLSSDNDGIIIKAQVVNTEIEDTVRIIIGGQAASVTIGRSTEIVSSDDNTHYTLPMSVLVTDANGNPVSGARVSLGSWPVQYATGYWLKVGEECNAQFTGIYDNEDENRNLILDPGEDRDNDDEITPPNTAAGAASPSIVNTDDQGVAAFNLVYIKANAPWIRTEISASTVVNGSETRSTTRFWLPVVEEDTCFLPHSPYNVEPKPANINLIADPDELTANGEATSQIRAVVTDANGDSVGSDVQVKFTVSSGTGGFPYAKSIIYTTAADGVAEATYTAGNELGQVTITATAEDAVGNVNITLSQGRLTLTASPVEVLADGQTTSAISATLIDVDGNPMPGVEMTYTISGGGGVVGGGGAGGGGVFADNNSTTITTYATSVTYKAGKTAGNVTITAQTKDGVSASVTLSQYVEEIGGVSLTVIENHGEPNDNAIPADGQSTAQIAASIINNSGDPVGSGVPVTFTTSAGTFPNGSQTFQTEVTGANGVVITSLTAANEVGTANITATSRNVTGTTAVQFTESGSLVAPAVIQILDEDGDGTPDYPDPDWIAVKGSRDQTATFLRFRALKSDGTVVDNGVPIQFSIHPSEKESELGVSLSKNADSTRNDDGLVSTVLYSGYKAGTVAVKAYYEDENGAEGAYVISSDITIRGGLPVGEAFGIEAESLVLSPTEDNQSTRINVTASDIYGNPVPKNTTITFRTYNTGGILEPLTNTISHEEGANAGYSYSWLYWTTNPAPLHGVVSVTAETMGGSSTHVTSIAAFPEDFNAKDNYILFAGTDGGGVYRSTNSGMSWTNTSRSTTIQGQNYIYPYINDVVVDWDNTNLVYAATGHGGEGSLYRSRDRGLTWDSNNPKEEWRGILPINTAVTSVICDYDDTNDPPIDNYSYVWVGTQGGGVYYAPDGNADYDSTTPIFAQSSSFGNGRYVQDIVRARGTHGPNAVLYAATANGIWRSANGGSTWQVKQRFSGDFINCLAIHPKSSGGADDVIYAGTETAGVWVSQDSGSSWVPYTDGMRQGDSWDESRMIKDLMIDDVNDILYAITYFWEADESRPEGNLFAYRMRPDGTMGDGAWFEANSNLPEYPTEPAGETKHYAQHALALISDVQGNPSSLFIGGQGINLYKAENGLETATPDWKDSGDGLTNRIMARTQVIFTGIGEPGSSPYFDYTFNVEPDTPAASLEGGPNVIVGFNVCAEDAFGNPPTPGSTISYSVDGGGETSLVTFGTDDYDFGTCSRKARFSVPMTFEETEDPDTGETEYGDLQTTVEVHFEDVLTGIRRTYRYN